jgi:metal-sulfur cluster biosynthetic enzyme
VITGAAVEDRIRQVLDEVLDPCSIGRGVPAGITDMGMVTGIDVATGPDGRTRATLALRLTSPGCTFQLYFDQQVRARMAQLDDVDSLDIVWRDEFDWSDDDMSPDLKRRLREKRATLLRLARPPRRPAETDIQEEA